MEAEIITFSIDEFRSEAKEHGYTEKEIEEEIQEYKNQKEKYPMCVYDLRERVYSIID